MTPPPSPPPAPSHPAAPSDLKSEPESPGEARGGPPPGYDFPPEDRRWSAWALDFALRILSRLASGRPREEIEELAMETMLRLIHRCRRTRVESAEALLRTIAHRVWVTHLRGGRVETAWTPALPDEDRAQIPDPRAARSFEVDSVVEARKRLRRAVVLFFDQHEKRCLSLLREYWKKKTWRQVAAERGLNEDTVRQDWSRRCMKPLREKLAREPGFLELALTLAESS